MTKHDAFTQFLKPLVDQMLEAAIEHDIAVLGAFEVSENDDPQYDMISFITPMRNGAVPSLFMDVMSILSQDTAPTHVSRRNSDGVLEDIPLDPAELTESWPFPIRPS
jgi:hypothetical protein